MVKSNDGVGKAPAVETSQDVDVVQMILNDRKKEASESSEIPGTGIITADAFFLDNNPRGGMRMETFRHLIKVLPESQLQELQVFFQRLSEGVSIDFKAIAYGKGEIKNFYASINHKRGREQFRIPAVDNMLIFLIFYIDGKVSCNFSMKELYEIVKL
jgi:hypothetical protein